MIPLPRRLEKWLRDATPLSRTDVREAVSQGRVRLSYGTGERLARLADLDHFIFASDQVWLDGDEQTLRRTQRTWLLHKPAGVVCTMRDPNGVADLSEFCATLPRGAQPVGRLDRDTSGALLFTTDGDLANALLKPHHRIEKAYGLWVASTVALDDARLASMRRGVDTARGCLRVARVHVVRHHSSLEVRPDGVASELEVVLTEGKNRQLRRICYAVGFRLLQLHRHRIAHLELGELEPRCSRRVSPEDVERLWGAVGGRAYVRLRQRIALERSAHTHTRLRRWLAEHPGPTT